MLPGLVCSAVTEAQLNESIMSHVLTLVAIVVVPSPRNLDTRARARYFSFSPLPFSVPLSAGA